MANKNPEAKITVKMLNDDFKKGSNELKKESQQISREFKLQSEQMKLTASATDKLQARIEFLSKKHENATKNVELTQKAYDQAKAAFGENSDQAEKMAKALDNAKIEEQKLKNDIELANRALKDQQTEAENTSSKLDDLGDKVKAVGDKTKEIGDGMTDAGARMTAGITAPIVGIGLAAKSAWAEVDDGLDTIVSKTGASGKTLESLEESFNNVASTTKFSMQQVGDSIGEVNTQFGLMGPELDDASIMMLKFADINGADVAGSAIKSKQAMDAFGLSADDLDMALDSVTLTAQNTGQSTDKLFDVVTRGAPQLKAMGLDFAQSVEVMGQFEKAGVDSSTAMSYLSRAQVTYAKDGLTMQEGLQKTMEKIKGAKDETEKMTIAAEVFGTKGATRMVDAIERGTFNFDEFADAAANSSGVVENTFEGMYDPIDNVDIAMNNLKLAGADLFTQLQEILLPVGLKIIEMLQGAVTWFSGLSDGMKQTIIVVLGIVAAIGPLLTWLGLMVSSIGSIIGAVGTVLPLLAKIGPMFNIIRTAMMALTGPVGIIIAIVVALAIVIYKNWDTIKAKTVEIFNAIKTFLVAAWTYIKEKVTAFIAGFITSAVTKFNSFKSSAMSIFNGIKSFFVSIWSGIQSFVSTAIGNLVSGAVNRFNNLKNNVSSIFNFLKNAITNPIETAKSIVLKIIDTIKGAFTRMKITIPKPKLPKVNITMGVKKVLGAEIPFPKFDISWFKTGGVFNRPVVAGNAGFGDVAEAIVPFEGQHAKRIAGLIAEQQNRINEISSYTKKQQPIHITVVSELDGYEVARNQINYIDPMLNDRVESTSLLNGVRG